jgi:chromosome segregation ATPase
MGSLIDELQRREAAAREEAGELRGRIEQLTERLARVEERLSRLVITRETVEQVLEVLEDAGRPLRAVQIAATAGLSTDKAKVEGLRSKLKRLVERGWLAEEAGPGLFALPARNGTGEVPNPG